MLAASGRSRSAKEIAPVAKEQKRQPKDFNHVGVNDKEITDPDRVEREKAGVPISTEYPKHLHKFEILGQPHTFKEVGNEQEEAAARRQGWKGAKEADADARAAQDAGLNSSTEVAAAEAKPKARAAAKPKKKATVVDKVVDAAIADRAPKRKPAKG